MTPFSDLTGTGSQEHFAGLVDLIEIRSRTAEQRVVRRTLMSHRGMLAGSFDSGELPRTSDSILLDAMENLSAQASEQRVGRLGRFVHERSYLLTR